MAVEITQERNIEGKVNDQQVLKSQQVLKGDGLVHPWCRHEGLLD